MTITIAATDPLVSEADDLQHELRQGPWVDAARHDGVFLAGDLRSSHDHATRVLMDAHRITSDEAFDQ